MEKYLRELNNQLTTMESSSHKEPNQDICEFCGKELKTIGKFYETNFYERCGCEKSIEAIELWREDRRKIRDVQDQVSSLENAIEIKKSQAQRLLEKSNLGRRFKTRTFETFDKNKNVSAYEKAFTYADTFDQNDGQGLLFIGSCGTGKTHLAAAITNFIISEFGISVKFGNFIDLLADIKSTWNKESEASEDDIIKAFLDIDLLVIDDIGKEKSTEWSNSVLYRVINRRYENYKATIITSNFSIPELEKAIGQATVSRIIEMCDGVKMDGEDVRKLKLK